MATPNGKDSEDWKLLAAISKLIPHQSTCCSFKGLRRLILKDWPWWDLAASFVSNTVSGHQPGHKLHLTTGSPWMYSEHHRGAGRGIKEKFQNVLIRGPCTESQQTVPLGGISHSLITFISYYSLGSPLKWAHCAFPFPKISSQKRVHE